jgi:hypothetical protein
MRRTPAHFEQGNLPQNIYDLAAGGEFGFDHRHRVVVSFVTDCRC